MYRGNVKGVPLREAERRLGSRPPVMNTLHMETIDASDFKARCLAILDRVQATGERVVILKRGRLSPGRR